MSKLNNPMRFSMKNRTIDIERWLQPTEEDPTEKEVTEIEVRPSEGDVYVHWCESGTGSESKTSDASETLERLERDWEYLTNGEQHGTILQVLDMLKGDDNDKSQ